MSKVNDDLISCSKTIPSDSVRAKNEIPIYVDDQNWFGKLTVKEGIFENSGESVQLLSQIRKRPFILPEREDMFFDGGIDSFALPYLWFAMGLLTAASVFARQDFDQMLEN